MPQPDPTQNAYLRTQVLTASPEQLRMLLIEGALRFCRQGRDGLSEKDYEKSYEGLSQAKDILTELSSSLDRDRSPELCDNLTALYMYMYRRLLQASLDKDPTIVDGVIELLEYDRDTWKLLLDQLRSGSASAAPAPAPVPGPSQPPIGAYRPAANRPQPRPAALGSISIEA